MDEKTTKIIINHYKSIISNPLLQNNCHLVAELTNSELIKHGIPSKRINGEAWLKFHKRDKSFGFENVHGGHAWNFIKINGDYYVLDNSIFHQREIKERLSIPIFFKDVIGKTSYGCNEDAFLVGYKVNQPMKKF